MPSAGDSIETSTSGSRSKNSKADLLRKCEYHTMGGSGVVRLDIFIFSIQRGMNLHFVNLMVVSELTLF